MPVLNETAQAVKTPDKCLKSASDEVDSQLEKDRQYWDFGTQLGVGSHGKNLIEIDSLRLGHSKPHFSIFDTVSVALGSAVRSMNFAMYGSFVYQLQGCIIILE